MSKATLRLLALPLVLLVGAPLAHAEDATLTLDAVLTQAWNEAPAVSSAEATARVAHSRIDIASAPGLPVLTGVLSANGNIRNSNTIFGEGAQCTAAALGASNAATLCKGVTAQGVGDAELDARWLILDFGRTSENVRSATLSSNASDSDVDATRENAALAAGSAFLALAGDLQLVEAREKLVGQEQKLLDVAHGRVETGVAAPIEETRAKVSLETAKVDVLTAKAAAKNDEASLALALGLDPAKPLTISQPSPLTVEDDPTRAADLAEQARPELRSLKLRVDASGASLLSARAGHLPSLSATASAGGNVTGLSLPSGTVGESGTVGALFTVPIFDATVNAEIASAEADELVSKAALHEETLIIRGQAAQAAIAVRSFAGALSAAEELQHEANVNYEEAAGRYQVGAAGLLELTDAETQQSSATLSLIQARFQLDTARLRLLSAIGTLGRTAGARASH